MSFAADGTALAVAGTVNASTKLVSMNDAMIKATEIRLCFDKRRDDMIIIIITSRAGYFLGNWNREKMLKSPLRAELPSCPQTRE